MLQTRAIRSIVVFAMLGASCSGGSSGALAQGCGPTRLKVTESVEVDAPPARVWSLVGDFQRAGWNAEVRAAQGSGGNTPDSAVRTLTLKNGATLGESLYKYDAGGMTYAYHIDKLDPSRLPVQNVSATLEVVGRPDGKSELRWKAAFYRYLKPGEGAPDEADAAAAAAMRAYMKAGLSGLAAKVNVKS